MVAIFRTVHSKEGARIRLEFPALAFLLLLSLKFLRWSMICTGHRFFQSRLNTLHSASRRHDERFPISSNPVTHISDRHSSNRLSRHTCLCLKGYVWSKYWPYLSVFVFMCLRWISGWQMRAKRWYSWEPGWMTLTVSGWMYLHRHTTHSFFSGVPRIVNYETGKAGAKARSLWRLEPLRIRWVLFSIRLFLSVPCLNIFFLLFHPPLPPFLSVLVAQHHT